ncbi:MAG TPA: NAD(P)/FAD-dependent oxidoreductase [Trueperaceae bacterium]|nr:NAD(P)/FAD-dependent oxidoreductase [Trueperaceae bacterium]
MDTVESRARPQVVIIGAGFGGLNAAKSLRHAPVDVLLIDANNFHTFQPLLYQVSTAALDSSDIAYQIRGIFERQKNFRFRKGTVVDVDHDAKQVVLADNSREGYDYLVIGAGAVYDDFGVPGVKDNGFVLKSLETSLALRSHILSQFEAASVDRSLIERGALTFVIVGGGPTGVEMAGSLIELFQRVLQDDYPELDLRLARVVMLEAGPDVLGPFSPSARRYAEKVLRRRGVDLRLSSPVVEASPNGVTLRSGEFIPSRTLIWAAGVRAHPLAEAVDSELTHGHRLVVQPDLSLPGHPDVFAIGDMAAPTDEAGKPLPQVAQVAIQGGKHVAKTIRARMQNREAEPFRYHDLGSMAIIGRNAGVADLSRTFLNIKLRGFIGWLGWLFLHLVYLPGHRNRISAFFSWAYNYLTYDRHARLILDLNRVEDFAAAKKAPRDPGARSAGEQPAADANVKGAENDTKEASTTARPASRELARVEHEHSPVSTGT